MLTAQEQAIAEQYQAAFPKHSTAWLRDIQGSIAIALRGEWDAKAFGGSRELGEHILSMVKAEIERREDGRQ
jgi:hypothetical protein